MLRGSDDRWPPPGQSGALAMRRVPESGLRSAEASRNARRTEGALGDGVELLQQVRELAIVASGDPSYDDTQRQTLAGKIRDLRAQLVVVANRGDGAGGYLFAGQGATPPFVDAAGGVR